MIISKEDPSDSDPMEINEVDILYPSKGNQSIVLHRYSMYAFFAWFVFALHRLPCVQILMKANAALFQESRRLETEQNEWKKEKEALLRKTAGSNEAPGSNICQVKDVEPCQKNSVPHSVFKDEFSFDEMSSNSSSNGSTKDQVTTKKFYHKTISLQTSLQKCQERCKELERENVKLKNAGLNAADSDLADQQAERYENLLDKNRALSEYREHLISKNEALKEENEKLKSKCQNLHELLNEEENDINDILELIKKMQLSVKASANPGPLSASIGVNSGKSKPCTLE